MKLTLGRKIAAGFGLGIVLIIAVAAVGYRSTRASLERASLVEHSSQVSIALAPTLLNDLQDAETGQRGYLITGLESYLEPYKAGVAQAEQRFKDLMELTADNPNHQRRLLELESLMQAKLAELQETIDVRRTNAFEAARAMVVTNRGQQATDRIRELFKEMNEEERNLGRQYQANAIQSAALTFRKLVLIGCPAAVSMFVAALLATRHVTHPIQIMSGLAAQIASGDLTGRLPELAREDELGKLARAFQGMLESLRGQTGEISDSVTSLTASSSEISHMTNQLASSTAETVTAVTQSSSTVEEVKQTTLVASQKARAVAETAQRAMEAGRAGTRALDENTATMNRIRGQMDSVAQSIMRLSVQTQAIGEIAATVSDLADQSDLLAVNASIEAAQAGEQGKGFAVVAQQIQSLAEQSKRATVQVRTILQDTQKATGAAVLAIEQGNQAVDSGVQQAERAGEAIRLLAGTTTEAAQAAAQIAASSQQQTIGMDQVALAMENIRQASTQAAESTRQAESAARNLQELGMRLKKLVERYNV